MWVVEQHPLDFPDVGCRQAPVVASHHHSEIDHGVSRNPSGVVHVGIDVAQGERPWRGEYRAPAVEPGVARSRDRSPSAPTAVDEDDVVQFVNGLEAEYEGRVAVLFQRNGSKERRFKAMGAAVADDTAKAP